MKTQKKILLHSAVIQYFCFVVDNNDNGDNGSDGNDDNNDDNGGGGWW